MAGLQRAASALNALWKLSLGVGILGATSTFSMYNVDGGQRALIFGRFQNGLIGGARGEGTHLYIPFLQWPIIVDVRTRYAKLQAETGSKDLQNVHLVLRVLYKPEVEKLTEIYRQLGADWDDKVLPSIGPELLTSTVAKYDAVELITQREQVSQAIREGLVERLGRYHILLEDVSITHLTFSPEYTSAIEKKQVAQQDAERSKFMVERAKQEALASMIRAEGESEAARLVTLATGPSFIELRRLEAAREIADTLAASPNVSYVPGGQVLFNLGGKI